MTESAKATALVPSSQLRNPRRFSSGSSTCSVMRGLPCPRSYVRAPLQLPDLEHQAHDQREDHHERHREPLAPEPELAEGTNATAVGLGAHRQPGVDGLLHRVDLEG